MSAELERGAERNRDFEFDYKDTKPDDCPIVSPSTVYPSRAL